MTRGPRTRLGSDESGATAIEYALLATLIAVVLIGVVASLGQSVREVLFTKVSTELVDHIEEGE